MPLYAEELLRLSTALPAYVPLSYVDGAAEKHSRLCGATITAHVQMQGRAVAAAALEVDACALGRASAAALLGGIAGASRDDVLTARAQLAQLLAGEDVEFSTRFAKAAVLRDARAYPQRHASVLLAWDAVLAALERAMAA